MPDKAESLKITGSVSPGGTFAPFRYPAFRSIWTANLLSQLGSMIQSVSAAWLMTDLTRSPQLVAAVQTSAALPILLFGVIAGAIADNFDRRKVMLAAQCFMLFASALLTGLSFGGLLTPWSLLLLTVAVGTGTAMNAPAWQASVRSQVGRRDLPKAISLNTIAFNLARSMGPALGGAIIAVAGVAAGFAVNALSYIALIVVLLRWRPEHPSPVRRPILPSIQVGIAFCIQSNSVKRVLIRGFCMGIGVSAFLSLLPLIVRGQLHGTELDYGMVLGSFGVGSIVGALCVSGVRRQLGGDTTVAVGALAFVVSMPLFTLTVSTTQALPLAFLCGVGWTICMTTLNVAMQVRSPEHILGRCLSIYQAVTFGAMAIGAWIWGAVSNHTGVRFALLGAAVWLAIAAFLLRIVLPLTRSEGSV